MVDAAFAPAFRYFDTFDQIGDFGFWKGLPKVQRWREALAAALDFAREGDVFIMNDPFDGGMHLPDIFVFKPLYHQGRRLAFAATVCSRTRRNDVPSRVSDISLRSDAAASSAPDGGLHG